MPYTRTLSWAETVAVGGESTPRGAAGVLVCSAGGMVWEEQSGAFRGDSHGGGRAFWAWGARAQALGRGMPGREQASPAQFWA